MTRSTKVPTEPGVYAMRCDENNYVDERIQVVELDGVLYAECPDLGRTPLDIYHNGLTSISWKPWKD